MIVRAGKAKGKLPGLRRRAEIVALTRAAARLGVETWIVGGALRDRLLGLPSPEIDVAVAGDAEGLARALEAGGLGRAVFLSKDRPGPRVFRVAGRRPIDIAEVEGATIGVDLARRDFTVNAMALPLGPGGLVDPFGGVADVLAKRLRCVKHGNLLEDPLRILRAARLWATLGLEPDRGVLAAALAAAHLFHRVAPERMAAELSRLLGSPRAAPALGWTSRAGILGEALGLALPTAKSASIARRLSALDGRSTRTLSSGRRRRVRLAFIAIQAGLGAPGTREWLGRRRSSREEARDAAQLVALAAARGHSARDRWRWVLDAGALAEDALVLLRVLGAAGRRKARTLAPLTRKPPRRVSVGGDDVVGWLAIEAGPRVGELLAGLRVAAAMGEVKNRRDARHWLTGQVRNGP